MFSLIVCNREMKKMSFFLKLFPVFIACLLCSALPGFSAETDSGYAMPKASDFSPAETSGLKAGNYSSFAPAEVNSKQEVASPAPALERKEHFAIHPLSIAVSPDDKKANLAIEKSFHLFTTLMKPRFSMWLERSGRYIEAMQEILKEKNMPPELVFLPIVESGFNPKAYSRARAAGPWQFISGTAKRYGLVIDWWRDERKDPLKSTVAAARYLNDLYEMFGSWSLALAAYNAGEGKIAKALRKSSSDDFWPLLGTKYIRKETKDYVPHYIAATMIANTPEEYGFADLAYHEPFEYEEVVLYVPVDLDVIAECAGTDIDTIRDLNPELRRWSTPPNVSEYTLRIPAGKADAFIEKLSKIADESLFSYDVYTIKKNDNLKKIAAKVKVPVSAILELNSFSGTEKLPYGHQIKLPPQGKYFADIDDRMSARKTRYKKSKAKSKKPAKTANRKSSSKSKTAKS
jgi:membrane-bound lytic murein transglycosylase D